MIGRWKLYIFTYFDRRFTNEFAESKIGALRACSTLGLEALPGSSCEAAFHRRDKKANPA
jgi:hypothetical protein